MSSNVNATTLAGNTADTLYIDALITLNSNVTWNFTTVIIRAPNGEIFWNNNSDLILPNCTTFNIDTSPQAPGLQDAAGGSASKRLVIAGVTIAVANTSSNNAAYSFAEFNSLGGLTKFTLSSNSPVCEGDVLTITATPDRDAVSHKYNYNWSISPVSGTFNPTSSNSYSSASTQISPTAGSYVVTCTIDFTGDLLATKTINVTVNAKPTISGTLSVCAGSTTQLTGSATAASTNPWVSATTSVATVSNTGLVTGVSAGTSSITYTNDNGCSISSTVTVNSLPTGSLSGSQTACNGSAATLTLTVTGTGTISGTLSDGTTFSGTAPTILVNVSPTTTTTYTISSLTNGTCGATSITGSATVTVPSGTAGLWTGATNNNWFNCQNWGDGKIPTSATNVTIPAVTNAPQINATGAVCKSLTVDGGNLSFTTTSGYLTNSGDLTIKNAGSITMTSGGALELQGNWLNQVANGFVYGSGTVIFSGGNTQTLTATTLETFYNLQINKTAGTVNLSNSITVNYNLILTNGIFVTGSNLFTWNNTSGSAITAPEPTYTANSTNYTKSFIATCDASGTPVTGGASSTVAYTGNVGFRIKNVPLNTNTYFPVGASFSPAGTGITTAAPNRMMINNQYGVVADFTVAVEYGDIGFTNGGSGAWRVNRIWYVKTSTSSPADTGKATMRLFFTKRVTSGGNWPTIENEVEDAYNYGQAALVEKDYSGAGNSFIRLASSSDILSFIGNSTNTEVYGQYTIGISPDIGGNKNGIGNFYRFSVVNPTGIILPVSIINLKTEQQNSRVHIQWTSVDEVNIDHYEIQRSVTGSDFISIGKVTAFNNGQLSINYAYDDAEPLTGKNYYRISAIDKNGKIIFSNISLVNITNATTVIKVYPNPVSGGKMNVKFINVEAGKYNLVIYDNLGRKIMQKYFEHPGGSVLYNLIVPAGTVKGHYHITIGGVNTKFDKTIMIE